MVKLIEIIPIGSEVGFKGKGQNTSSGIINAAHIHTASVTYHVSWWNGEEYKTATFCAHEIFPLGTTQKTKIGFASNG